MIPPFLALLVATTVHPPAEPPRPPPRIAGVFPPGVSLGTRITWTISGWDLDGVTAVEASGSGLRFDPPRVEPSGRSLSVVVSAGDEALDPYPEVRVVGPRGTSNLAIVRVDALPQVVEAEPNDREPAAGQVIAVGSAVAGVIRPLDVDRFRVVGAPGRAVTLDWETRRLGTAITPVLTVTGPGRAAIRQVRGSPGGDRDCRAAVVVPPAGWFEVELRDNTFGGDDRARYRLRLDPEPFASAVFPLGGPAGRAIDLAVAGGSMPAPLTRRVVLPADPVETWLDPGAILRASEANGRSTRPWPAPSGRLRAADPLWPEVAEPGDLPPGQPWTVPGGSTGVTINGRLGRPGEVDRCRVEAKAGDRIRCRVEATAAGSWLDSVVTVLGPDGTTLGEGDDRKPRSPLEPPTTIDGASTTDSEVDVLVRVDGLITVELTDRSGAGGLEYGYRLEIGPPRVDFSMHLLRTPESADPGPEARSLADLAGPDGSVRPGAFGVFNLRPGTTAVVPLVILPRGRPGTIDVEAVGLPAGVRAERLTIRTAPAPRAEWQGTTGWDAPIETHDLRLQVAPDAPMGRGTFRVVATSRPAPSGAPRLRREADAVVGVDAAGGPGRPVIRRLSQFPIQVLGPD